MSHCDYTSLLINELIIKMENCNISAASGHKSHPEELLIRPFCIIFNWEIPSPKQFNEISHHPTQMQAVDSCYFMLKGEILQFLL